jgi:hypothetical protein
MNLNSVDSFDFGMNAAAETWLLSKILMIWPSGVTGTLPGRVPRYLPPSYNRQHSPML